MPLLKIRKALVTGSGGLIGSSCARLLLELGWQVVGIDNNMREWFFGPAASTLPVLDSLRGLPNYRHYQIDIRSRREINDIVREERPDLIVHAAAQPSHDKAASIPFDDFDINAVGTLNILVAAREWCRDSPFFLMSTNKVYGDRPNGLKLRETETRYDYSVDEDGIDESMSIDQCLHSVFGASKVAADVLCQEFARYFNMPVGIFRAGCVTGPAHAAVELHGFLAYIVDCAVNQRPYVIFGHKGKQVRDQIHSADVAALVLDFSHRPRVGEVYNLGGGRANSISVLETISLLRGMGVNLEYSVDARSRTGDHICYISNLAKLKAHFPGWRINHSLPKIVEELIEHRSRLRNLR